MRTRLRWISYLLAAVMLALPGAAWAQSAGDDQYQDPFGDQDQEQSQDNGAPAPTPTPAPDTSTSSDQPAPTPTPAPATPAAPTSATTAQAVPAAEQLPRTGENAGLLALGGAVLLGSGVALRVRVSRGRDRA